ncbi:Temperature shock-inducible protein 1 [Cyberlindnera fabianii]|uniref:Temperature shock-inducible protein 1 n=1 Tax=Cyberlindnera fabianii TaxID=36022 RepID=A0A1V2L3W4_CYBFA|nr:Temperature shock-inducible protein 1 [Cyberlindnera fabianii]
MQKFILLALAASFVAADKNSELEGLLADLKANLNDYLSQVSEGNTPPPQLLSLAQEARTYTDNSYTTLFDQVDINEVKVSDVLQLMSYLFPTLIQLTPM